jgi:hypothetical protein
MAFARAMEMTLRKHDAKKGGQPNWRKDSVAGLISHAQDELDEVDHALTVEEMAREAVDLGNMAMMIWDRQLQLPEALDKSPTEVPPSASTGPSPATQSS